MTDISIIIPTRNRVVQLLDALQSIATIVDPGDTVEVLVVDNGSTDQTAEVCRAIKQKYPKHEWRYFYDDMPGLLSGRHRGAKEARGEILAYLDDDVLLAPTWLEALKDAFSDPGVVLVGGPSSPRYEAEPPPWLNELWWEFEGGRSCGSLSLIDLGKASKPIDPCCVWGLNFSIRKDILYEGGGFHPGLVPKALQRYQGDGETGLSLKIKKRGFTALYHPGVAVTHVIPAARLTRAAFERRAFYQGVCDSYTQIRREGMVQAPDKSWKDLLRPIKNKLAPASLLQCSNARVVRELMARAHMAGFQFHQREVRNDPKLLEWVLRPDYFDYRLPEGWKEFMNQMGEVPML